MVIPQPWKQLLHVGSHKVQHPPYLACYNLKLVVYHLQMHQQLEEKEQLHSKSVENISMVPKTKVCSNKKSNF